MNPIQAMTERRVAIWLDTLSRELVEDGRLDELMGDLGSAIPGVFAPVEWEDTELIDGGVANAGGRLAA